MSEHRTTIGVFINNLEAEYQRSIWNGIDDAARKLDVDVIFLGRGNVSSTQLFDIMRNRILSFVRPERFDALIVVSSTISGCAGTDAIFCELSEFIGRIPVVNLGPAYPGVASITVDNRSGVRDVVRHLIEAHGRRRFVFIAGSEHNIDSSERMTAFLETIAEYRLDPVDGGILRGMFSYKSAQAALSEWLERGIPFDAIVAASDNMAFAAYDELRRRGISVPEDVSVVGFDDNSAAGLFSVPLTTVRQPVYELGHEALLLAVRMIAGGSPPESIALKTLPVYRQSCGCLSGEVQAAAAPESPERDYAASVDAFMPGLTGKLSDLLARIPTDERASPDFLSSVMAALRSPAASPEFFLFLDNFVSRLERSLWRGDGYVAGAANAAGAADAAGETLSSRELALHQARILVKEHAETWQANRVRTFISQSVRHHRAVVDLISSFGLEKLITSLDKNIRMVGINSLFLSLFVPGSRNARSTLVLGMYRGETLRLPQDGFEFDSDELFPRELIPGGRRLNMFAEILYHQDRELGLLVIEENPLERQQDNALSNQIMGAVRSSMLMDELRDKDRRLNEAFAELMNRADKLENANAQIRQNQAQLLLSEKMATLGRLTAGMAHEMNTPLGAAMASLSEARNLVEEYRASAGDPDVTKEDHQEIAAEMGKMIDLAARSVERAAGFIRTIKGQTRMGGPSGEAVAFDIRKSVRDTVCLLGHAIRKGNVSVVLDEDETPVNCLGYPDKFAQIMTNLMVNAIDAMSPSGGTMTVRVGERDSDAGNGPSAIVSLSDTGCGIAGENLSRIFEPLYTTKPVGVGTGLGLTIVHDIVVGDFKGDISVASELGKGTTFTIVLPSKKE